MDYILERQANVVVADLAEHGGGTYERGTLLPFKPETGYAVAIGGIRLPASMVTAEQAAWALKAVGGEYETSLVGTWTDGGTVYFDAVRFFAEHRRDQALLCGYQHQQEAIYGFKEAASIYLDEEPVE